MKSKKQKLAKRYDEKLKQVKQTEKYLRQLKVELSELAMDIITLDEKI